MSKRCLGCMEVYGNEFQICPYCGYIEGTKAEDAIHLEPGTLLHDRFIVGKVLGFGGFGVTYIGWDGKLEQKVAIKEYLPSEFSTRMPGQSSVTVFNGDKSEQFRDGLNKFVEEARRLAKFQNESGIVKVFDSFTENETAYIIMEFLDGETLTERLKREKTIPEDEAVGMLLPLMNSLQTVHQEGILHRDIAPDNIFLTKSGDVKLIDFGASRYATTSHSRSLTVIIKPGYSPEEQYRSRGDQGAYTDVYALAATLYKMLTGKTPPDSLERRAKIENQKKEILEEPHKLNKNISINRENAILNAMNVRIEDRTPDVMTFMSDLNADPPVKRVYGKIKKIDLYSWPLWLKIFVPSLIAVFVVFGVLLTTGVIRFPSLYSDEIVIPDGMVVVPDIEGLDKDEALQIINDSHLIPSTEGNVASDYVAAGKIIVQSPMSGSYLVENGTVVLTVSSGGAIKPGEDGMSTVPYVIWDTQEDAVLKLQQAGLGTPEIQTVSDENVAAGKVISQSVKDGEKIAEGTVITLVVSSGPVGFEMPDTVGTDFASSYKALKEKGLVVTSKYESSDTVVSGTVISQSIDAGTIIQRGTEVILTVSSGSSGFEMPDMVGKDLFSFENTLKDQGLIVTVKYESNDTIASGKVISQSVEAGTIVYKNTAITLKVSNGSAGFAMPNMVGKDLSSSEKALKDLGLLVSVKYESNDTVASGKIISQSVNAGTIVNKGIAVTLNVSNGSAGFAMPNMVGKDLSASEKTLKDLGLLVTVKYENSNTVASGKIISQSLNAGTTVKKGTAVTLHVSNGPAEFAMPNMVGKDMSSAQSTLKAQGITVIIVYESSNTVASGKVISQSINSGTMVKKGSVVTLKISSGKATISVANVVGKSESDAKSILSNQGFNVTVVKKYDATVPAGKVISQSPAAGSEQAKDAVISIYVSEGKNSVTVSYNANGGNVSQSTSTVYLNSTYDSLPTPSRDYYTFTGWFTSPTDGVRIDKNTKVTNSSSHTLYAHWSENPVSDWIYYLNVPSGAQIISEKWIYTKTETTTSESSSLNGWQQTGSEWKQTGQGTWYYATFPNGFDTGDSLYGNFKHNALSAENNGSTKREVSGSTFNSYIYWHWNYLLGSSGKPANRVIGYSYNEATSGGRTTHFAAFEDTANYGHRDSNGAVDNDVFFCNRDNYTDVSWWWFRFDTYKQTYTDYQLIYKYQRTIDAESMSPVTSGGDITDVWHYIKYREK